MQFKHVFSSHVGFYMFNKLSTFYSAIAKDYIVGKILLEVLSSYTDKNPTGIVERKAGGKYVIFIVSLFLEDLGQTLCQACCKASLFTVLQVTQGLNCTKTEKPTKCNNVKFIHYEQFETKRDAVAIANAALMLVLALINLKAAYVYKPNDTKT